MTPESLRQKKFKSLLHMFWTVCLTNRPLARLCECSQSGGQNCKICLQKQKFLSSHTIVQLFQSGPVKIIGGARAPPAPPLPTALSQKITDGTLILGVYFWASNTSSTILCRLKNSKLKVFVCFKWTQQKPRNNFVRSTKGTDAKAQNKNIENEKREWDLKYVKVLFCKGGRKNKKACRDRFSLYWQVKSLE